MNGTEIGHLSQVYVELCLFVVSGARRQNLKHFISFRMLLYLKDVDVRCRRYSQLISVMSCLDSLYSCRLHKKKNTELVKSLLSTQ